MQKKYVNLHIKRQNNVYDQAIIPLFAAGCHGLRPDKKSTNNLARRALFCAFVYGEGATDDSGLTDYTGE